jgi:hydrogenase maturation protease
MSHVVILGVGNVLQQDDGIGVRVVEALQARGLPSGVQAFDAGTSPDAYYLAEGADKLILVDAVKAGGAPGSVYRLRLEEAEGLPAAGSVHEIGLIDGLRLLELSGTKPKQVVIIGVEPREVGLGMELSSELEGKLEQIAERVLEEACAGA